MIHAQALTKRFGGIAAVDNVSLQLHKGEIISIVGPDGAGKSTLLRMFGGVLSPDSGTLYYDNKPYNSNIYYVKEHIGYMPQRFGLYEDLSVLENIMFFGKIFGMREKEINAMLPSLWLFSRLEPFKNRLAGKLSGGMKQKLGLACCLVHRPNVLLLDEPTNGVDPVSRHEFWKILYDLCIGGAAIAVSTAYLDEAERSNRVALMHNGSLYAVDSPSKLKKMIDKAIIEIITDKPVEAHQILRNISKYHHVMRNGNAVRVFADDIRQSTRDINKLMATHKITVASIHTAAPSLSDTFAAAIAAR